LDKLSAVANFRLAVLDMGTNALRLLLVQTKSFYANVLTDKAVNSISMPFAVLARARLNTRLGEGLSGSSPPLLLPAAQTRAREAVEKLQAQARCLGAEASVLVATHACRQALNGREFVRRLAHACGLTQARIISAEEESRLTRLGVGLVLQGAREGAWVLDIGAGSCELAPFDNNAAGLYLPWGCLSLKEKLAPSEPPDPAEIAALRAFLAPLLVINKKVKRLVVTSGTSSALAALDLGLNRYEPEQINNHIVSGEKLASILERLAGQNLEQRRGALGQAADRAEIIVTGLLIAQEILRCLDLKELTVINAGILEGCALDYFRKKGVGIYEPAAPGSNL
jgi:exopolyphosphatase/guanosine-5'-triphosphate,3'-diphosphate pyrophosphatase